MRHVRVATGIMAGMSETVVMVGGGTVLAPRVAALALADPAVELTRAEVADPALKDALADADVVLYLGASDTIGPDGLPAAVDAGEEVAAIRTLLEVAASVGVTRLVVVSSAMVYGAWANNPVPLTEEAPLRPDPALPYAAGRAEIERLALDWRTDRDAVTVAVLRPTVSVGAESVAWLAASPWSASALRAEGAGRPSQFLHLDDLASAIDHARRHRLDGPYNVSPDGWLPPDDLAELAGPVGRLHLPSGLTRRLAALRTEIGRAGPPEGGAYTRQSVGGGQRSLARHRVGAAPPQRRGLRRGGPGRTAGVAQRPAPPGALVGGRRRAGGRRRGRRGLGVVRAGVTVGALRGWTACRPGWPAPRPPRRRAGRSRPPTPTACASAG